MLLGTAAVVTACIVLAICVIPALVLTVTPLDYMNGVGCDIPPSYVLAYVDVLTAIKLS
jgi:hypothetical protein